MFHMERKDYRLEIVLNLLNRESHIREMAKSLDTNHTNIIRKIGKLFKENVVDYREEGKNKTYFIKKTAEAKAYAVIAENYKLTKILGKYPYLRSVIDRIQEEPKVKLALLFGSHAKGTAKEDSDIDIYIETADKELKKEFEKIDSRISIKIGKYDRHSLLIKEIEKNHVIIKGAEIYYEKRRIFD